MQGRGGRGQGRGQGGGGMRNSLFDFDQPFPGFGGFGGIGGHGSLFSSVFGGRNPFDDPFFNRPFGGGMLESNFFNPIGNPFPEMPPFGFIEQQAPEPKRSRGPIIEEITSDDDEEDNAGSEKYENPRKLLKSGNGPYVEDPDDQVEENKRRHLQHRNDHNGFNHSQMQAHNGFNRSQMQAHNGFNPTQMQPQTHSFTFQSSSVTYGGANGAYYTKSKAMRTGSDGLTIAESKEADTVSRQATHKISRALHDKGHSVARKLNTDGKVDTMQTLHNLNEDEISGFEEAWKGKAQKHLPGWTGNFDGYGIENTGASSSDQDGRRGWALPSSEPSQHSGRVMPDLRDRVGSSRPQQHPGTMKVADDVKNRSSHPRGRARD
ncbi:uncharacterized protein LOC133778260 [Humulus lupulus]|uniref:uncharacterized protein LOC133778260 n=1 Tax=Humulus lupulus TaxID=3486 RepID=UPI002B40D946|nr:uncharacterized protein LOC133778260 [Humulus lupulus]XP_062074116.1 uncharacterized protein LOC133778260 [Humulus lupulus]